MKAYQAEEIRRADFLAITEYGIPSKNLMEAAGKAVADIIVARYPEPRYSRITIFCGSGNNGGDGYVIARLLQKNFRQVSVIAAAAPKSQDAQLMRDLWEGEVFSPKQAKEMLASCDLVVDALLGTGIQGTVTGVVKDLIEQINQAKKCVISVDVPSGIDADTGAGEQIVKAECTVTFAAPKQGLFITPASLHAGKVILVDIGIPNEIFAKRPYAIVSDPSEKYLWIPLRKKDSNKGSFGKMMAIGGSRGMAGSICLAAMGALRTGTGLLTIATPSSIEPFVAMNITEATTLPLSEKEGKVSAAAAEEVLEALQDRNCGIVGCGLGIGKEQTEFVFRLLENTSVPLVIDADALTAIADQPERLRSEKHLHIVTPHPGEMGRFFGVSAKEIQQNRLSYAKRFAEISGAVTLLKGAGTIACHPDGRVYINRTGNPALAKGGSGDLLLGMIGGFLSSGDDHFTAACKAAYYHGLAAERYTDQAAECSALASEIANLLPAVLKEGEHRLFTKQESCL